MKNNKLTKMSIAILLVANLFSQSVIRVPNDGAGDPRHMKKGYMDGNRVYLEYRNKS